MTKDQQDRLIHAAEQFAGAFEQAVTLFGQWYDRVYPVETAAPEAIVHDPREQTQADPQSREEYDSLPDDAPGRFTQLIEAAKRQNTQA